LRRDGSARCVSRDRDPREGARRHARIHLDRRRVPAVRRGRGRAPRAAVPPGAHGLPEDAVNLSALGFARPELLVLLLAVPLIAALVALAYRARIRALRSFGGATPLVSRSGARWLLKSALVLVALASLLIALAGPYVDLRARAARRLGVDIVLAVDVSQSMAARDVEPDRLRAARH